MKFILWTLVWLGLEELAYWRIYKYRAEKYLSDSPGALILWTIVTYFLYFYLYIKFVR